MNNKLIQNYMVWSMSFSSSIIKIAKKFKNKNNELCQIISIPIYILSIIVNKLIRLSYEIITWFKLKELNNRS